MEEMASTLEGEVPVSGTLLSPPCTSPVETLSPPLVETINPSPAMNAATSPVFIRGLNFVPDSEDEAEKDVVAEEASSIQKLTAYRSQ